MSTTVTPTQVFNASDVDRSQATCLRVFRAMKPEERQQWKLQYEQILDPNSRHMRDFPWMRKAWQSGLDMLNQVINEASQQQ